MEQMVTIKINGCEVTVPAEQEQIYREVLADKNIDGHTVSVVNGKVTTIYGTDYMTLDTMELLLKDAMRKRYALAGQL